MVVSALLISVHFHDGRYHGSGTWPPAPARLFQALVAGAARGGCLSTDAEQAFKWLEGLGAPVIAAPPSCAGQSFQNFVPNNDLDAVGGDPKRIGEIRTAKTIRPRTFDVAVPLLYAWTFEQNVDAARHAQAICASADSLYQLGRGVDMAWATGEVVDDAEARFSANGGVAWRPNRAGSGNALACPRPGSLASLTKRFEAMRKRFKPDEAKNNGSRLFEQAPKPDFAQVPYNSSVTVLLYDIMRADTFAPQPLTEVAALAGKVRILAVERLMRSAWRRDDPKRKGCIESVFVGRDAGEADKARRICITPLPSIGHVHTERSIRRVLVTVPPDCPIATGDIEWAFAGLMLADPETGEVSEDTAELVSASDRTMLAHYGTQDAARLWQTITPAALPERAARRRIDPTRMREEAKGSSERLHENAMAEGAVRQALRHAGIEATVATIRVQREPFEAKDLRAEAFAKGTRFANERLWHVEVGFACPLTGPLVIGDGRYFGLGQLKPVRRTDDMLAFDVVDGLTDAAEAPALTRALRRAVMARVQVTMRKATPLPEFFTGHAADGAPSRSGRHEHLAFVFDAPRKRLLIMAPHILEHRAASRREREHFFALDEALEDFRVLRAGTAGRLALVPGAPTLSEDPLLALSQTWESLTPYHVTRHARTGDPATALEIDLLAECRRSGLPRPDIEIVQTCGRPGLGLFGRARLKFQVAVKGPLLLGRDRHFGGGLFAPTVQIA